MVRGLKCYGTGNSYKIPSLVPASTFSPSQAFRKPPTENQEKGRSGENEKIKVGKGTEFTVSPYNSQSKQRKKFVFSPEHVTSFTKVHWQSPVYAHLAAINQRPGFPELHSHSIMISPLQNHMGKQAQLTADHEGQLWGAEKPLLCHPACTTLRIPLTELMH